jgi:hypothetical protein
MAISSLQASPAVSLPGQAVQVCPVGTWETALELRWYLSAAPASSALPTLETYEDLGKERASIRLESNASGATFTPDVPGQYTVALYPTTIYRFHKGYSDALPATGELAQADNEEDALPAYAGGTAAVTPITLDVWVADSISMTIGQGADTATLRILTADNEVVTAESIASLLTKPVTLTPGTSAAAKVGVYDADVLTVLDAIAEETADNTPRLIQNLSIGWGQFFLDPDGSSDAPLYTLFLLVTIWNRHLLLDAGATIDTHGGADATNPIALSNPTDLATSIAVLNQAKTKYAAHRIKTSGSTHGAADSTNVVTAPDATTFATACDLWEDLWLMVNRHAVMPNSVHTQVGVTKPVDGAAGQHLERPRTTLQLIQRTTALRTLYNGHLGKTTTAAGHANPDTDNTVTAATFALTLDGIASLANALADSIEHHGANLKTDGTAAASAYHESGGNAIVDTGAKVQGRASAQNPESIVKTLSGILIAMQAHALNDDVHGSEVWGKLGPDLEQWPYHARLTKAWLASVGAVTPAVPAQFNSAASLARLLYGAK